MASSDMTDMSVSWQNSSEELTVCYGAVTGEPAAIFMYVMLALTTILVVVLNPLCLVVLRRTSSIQDTTKTFMASLTISDLCTGIFWGIPKLIEYASVVTPALEDFICVMASLVAPLFFTTSILSLLLMTIDRYIAIVHSLHYPRLMTLWRSKVIVALVWVAALVEQVALSITAEAQSSLLCNFDCAVCDYMYLCIIVISLGIILVLYVHILKIARHQARRIAAQNYIANPQGEQNAPHRVSTRSATTVIIVTGSAFLCWAPQIVNVTLDLEVEQYPCAIFYITEILFLTNGWLNVVIYYWRNRELREAMRSLVTSHRR
ncbi:melanocyte-stimulating hormone receptor-like [Patiria miniata]|uniref:G-protein coupled receptors family 1 profile domain-containing protein n=1 Tax=Patiria miniata TaxID=46514 RepID=A0A914ASA8_PATMI|nr:melanocyte-stimulating hormone receptor-like [Patiria miniata]